jgi:thiosulfate dehydrogenase
MSCRIFANSSEDFLRRSQLYGLRGVIIALPDSSPMLKTLTLTLLTLCAYLCSSTAGAQPPSLETLLQSNYLDDYYSNVVFGYRIISETEKYGARYRGNQLRCTNCHLDAGRKADAIPLNIAGMYPKWRSKNGQRNGIGLRIRECFAYSLDGIMPPEDSPEVLAIAAYINYLSYGQLIGKAPAGRGVPTLPDTGFDPNPAHGKTIYMERCASCHGNNGEGVATMPPLWGMQSYNHAAGMTDLVKSAGFIWANMPLGQERSLSHQQAKDVAAYINMQIRPGDPRNSKLLKLIEKVTGLF